MSKCIDCKKIITNKAIRCMKCNSIFLHLNTDLNKKISLGMKKNGIKRKTVIIICKYCGRKKEVYHNYKNQQTCSVSCAAKLRALDPVYINKLSKALTAKEWSIINKKAYKDGKLVAGGTTKWIDIETSNGKIRVQGSYEVRACKILDNWKLKGKITNWEYTKDRIPYTDEEGNSHIYLLDFKVFNKNGTFYYIETKGWKKEIDDLKWKAAKEQGYKLKVWFDKQLIKYEKLLRWSKSETPSCLLGNSGGSTRTGRQIVGHQRESMQVTSGQVIKATDDGCNEPETKVSRRSPNL